LPTAPAAANDFDRLARIGWRAERARELPVLGEGQRVARIVAQHRSGYRAHDGGEEFAVQAPAAMVRAGRDPRERPAVGDWVVVDPGRIPTIATLLPRTSLLTRGAAGERLALQVIAANVDTVFVVCGLDQDYNPRRIERYLMVIRGSGARAVVVLTKRDLCPDAEEKLAEIRAIVGTDGDAVTINARDLADQPRLAPWLQPGDSAVPVGSSGAGKSTLTNLMLGTPKQRTGEVREHDSRGRHTTTHRALLPLPGGACLIDTPGMREIKLTGEESLDAGQFADIDALAAQCRFSDCQHRSEPGCRVREALASGSIDQERLSHYFKLGEELASARDQQAEQQRRKSHARVQDKALGKRLIDKYGSRGT
jgi:ribosome biogenesis GTPase